MDVPNHRSSHCSPVPRGGGVAVVATLAGVCLFALEPDRSLTSLVICCLALASVGLLDDVRSLSSEHRLVAQVAVAAALAVSLTSAGTSSWWWLGVLIVALVGYVNAFNFMDGVNGISSLMAVAVGAWWAWVGSASEDPMLRGAGLVLAGVAVGFLPWNAPRARVFLGDVGSYGVGIFIGGLSVYSFSQGLPVLWGIVPLIVYGADTGWVLVKRARGGHRLTEPHRDHVYQQLVDAGWPHIASALLCAGAGAAATAVAALAGASATGWVVLACAAVVLAYLNVPRLVRLR
ncbi:MraY family glycosyltransferase [Nocardioides sp. Soil774]|uniref:MraY family glycosyltransferase n=1 Tax=Nocardioides sp. Soil774 TaxID=1736408 RepID=UPI0012F8F574|nr:glycosyltransferase family 4 protein [Nocardioides sp. Soil774]